MSRAAAYLDMHRLDQLWKILILRITTEELHEIGKSGPLSGMIVPAALHYRINVSRTDIWLWQTLSAVHQLNGIHIGYVAVRRCAQGKHLPQCDPKGPNIARMRKDAIVEALRRIPADGPAPSLREMIFIAARA